MARTKDKRGGKEVGKGKGAEKEKVRKRKRLETSSSEDNDGGLARGAPQTSGGAGSGQRGAAAPRRAAAAPASRARPSAHCAALCCSECGRVGKCRGQGIWDAPRGPRGRICDTRG